nr:immunoglobulin light chain junction region [Macaca mulatta]
DYYCQVFDSGVWVF